MWHFLLKLYNQEIIGKPYFWKKAAKKNLNNLFLLHFPGVICINFSTQKFLQYFGNQTILEMKCMMFHFVHRNLRNHVHKSPLSIRISITIVIPREYGMRGEFSVHAKTVIKKWKRRDYFLSAKLHYSSVLGHLPTILSVPLSLGISDT